MQREFRWLLLLGAAAVVVILFVVLRPSGDDGTDTTTTAPVTSGTTTGATSTAQTRVTRIPIRIEGGKPVGGIADFTVKQGSRVEIVVHSDVADEIHVHGYDLKKDVPAGGTARIAFTADIAGRFEAELEDRAEKILDLTVEP